MEMPYGYRKKTVSYNKVDRVTGESYTYGDIVESMRTNGWKGDPVNVVKMPDGKPKIAPWENMSYPNFLVWLEAVKKESELYHAQREEFECEDDYACMKVMGT